MMQLFKSPLKRALAAANIFPTVMTDAADVRSLIGRLHSVQTESGLIRLGPAGDGGYLVPDDLEGIEACFSPGVSTVSEFESDCAERGMRVFLADKSVDRPPDDHTLFHFTKRFIGAFSNEDFMTMDDWVSSSLPETDSDLLLQVDIEGYEYEVFLSTAELLMSRFRIIIAEFHDLEQLWYKPYFGLLSRTFDKILQSHTCVHIHPNNCCGSVKHGTNLLGSIRGIVYRRFALEEKHSFPMRGSNWFPRPIDETESALKRDIAILKD